MKSLSSSSCLLLPTRKQFSILLVASLISFFVGTLLKTSPPIYRNEQSSSRSSNHDNNNNYHFGSTITDTINTKIKSHYTSAYIEKHNLSSSMLFKNTKNNDLFVTDKFLKQLHDYSAIYEKYLLPWKLYLSSSNRKTILPFRYFEIGLGCLIFYAPRGPKVGIVPSGLGYLFIKNYIPQVDYYGLDYFPCNFSHLGKEHQEYLFPTTVTKKRRILTTLSSDFKSISNLLEEIKQEQEQKQDDRLHEKHKNNNNHHKFSFIVDDGSHLSMHMIESFLFLFRHALRSSPSSSQLQSDNQNLPPPPRSTYCIEDLSASWSKMGTGGVKDSRGGGSSAETKNENENHKKKHFEKQLFNMKHIRTTADLKNKLTAVVFIQSLMSQMISLDEILSHHHHHHTSDDVSTTEHQKEQTSNLDEEGFLLRRKRIAEKSSFKFIRIVEWIETIECQREVCCFTKRERADERIQRLIESGKIVCDGEGEVCVLRF